MLDWKDYFKPPFFTDEFNPGMVWDDEFELVSSPTDLMEYVADNNVFLAERVMENVVEAVNAKCEGREPKCTVQFADVKYSGSNDGSVLYFTAYGDKMSIDIRGWGMLTASRKLSPDDAAVVQNSLGQFIADCLIEASNITTDGEQK